jgi:CARDB
MRRGLVLCAVALVGMGTVAGAVSAANSRAHLRGFECKRALDPSGRVVSVRAVMRPVSGTRHMAMRFELLRKAKTGGPDAEVPGGDLDTWITPADTKLGQRPGDVWIVNHPVSDLAAPAHYHFRVSFRWTGTQGRTLASAVRVGPTCYQPELRPDLLVVSITVQPIPGQSSSERYVAVIGNHGRTAAGPFQVWFSYGQTVEQRNLTGLQPQKMVKETFTGPECTTTAPTVTVDPTHQVDDANSSNNSMTANCSGSTGSSSST